MMSRNATAIYVFLSLSMSWCIQIPTIMVFGLDSSVTSAVFLFVMWTPTLLALIFILRNPTVRKQVLWRLGKLGYLPLGIIVQMVIGFWVVGVLVASGLATSGWFTFQATGFDVLGGPWLPGQGFQAWPLYVPNVITTGVIFSVFNLVATTGGEFAWRGFLQGQLTRQMGVLPGIFLLAAIWWAWHLPGLLFGYNFPEYPHPGAFVLFPLQMIGASLFLGWLTIKSGSFWPAALAHGAVNSVQQGLIDNLSKFRDECLNEQRPHSSLDYQVPAEFTAAFRANKKESNNTDITNVAVGLKIGGRSDLDEWLAYYNNDRTHQGKKCYGRTPMQTLEDGKNIWTESS